MGRLLQVAFTCALYYFYVSIDCLKLKLNLYVYPIVTFILAGIITDLDENSKSPTEKNTWFAYYLKGYLSYNPNKNSISISWDKNEDRMRLTTTYSSKGRGAELSELVVFDGRLMTFDDRTGMVFEIIGNKIVPWLLLMDGDGKKTKGFKTEWATVKDEMLYIGSMGKEWTTATGEFNHHDPMFIKTVSNVGLVSILINT